VLLRLASYAGGESEAELAVLAAVDHPRLARLVDFGPLPGGGRFVARRWIDGVDLERWAAGRAPEEIGRLAAGVAEALEHLHRLGFVHADLKPENVLVDAAGEPVLCDFGLSRRVGPDAGDAPGSAGVSGTLYAIAPETLLGAPPSPSSDLFALGAMLHRLLAGQRATARAFYARFPARSFFDAAESPPDQLPTWARDLVAALVARDPSRRPASAGAVARTLRMRLGVSGELARAGEELRLPIDLGRERWLAELHAALVAEDAGGASPNVWIRLPAGESAPAFAATVRLFASLRGTATVGLDLDREAARAGDPMALDRWARRRADGIDGVAVASLEQPTSWSEHGLELLVRALRQRAARKAGDRANGRPRLVVASAAAPPASEADAFREVAPPPLAEPRFLAFLAQHLPEEEQDRRASFGRLLLAQAGGASTRLDRLLRRAAGDGWMLPDGDEHWRLRPGPLEGSIRLAPDEGAAAIVEELDERALDALAALHVAGGRLSGAELDALGFAGGAECLLALTERRLAGWEVAPHGPELVLVVGLDDPRALGDARLASLHARRAEALAARGDEEWRVLAHRLGAGEDVAAALDAELERMLRKGAAELALALLERIEGYGRELGRDVLAEHPRFALARANAWSALGRPELAERALERLEESAETGGLALLGRARLAAERREAEAALVLCADAERVAPELAGEAHLARVQILHELGRDDETIEAARDVAGASPRQRAFLLSLAAVSAFRLGRVDEARERLEALLAEAGALDDRVLEGALRIDLATIARRTGDVDRAVRELRRAIECHEAAGHATGLAHARSALGGVLRERGEMVDAEALLATAMGMRERLGDPRGANTVRGIFGLLLAERGHARGAIEELERSAARMEGAQKLRFVPLLVAKADEVRARIGMPPSDVATADDAPDPRVLVARARAAWMRGDDETARAAARRGLELARSLKLAPVAAEAGMIAAALDPAFGDAPEAPAGTVEAEDRALLALLDSPELDAVAARELAASLEARGRDDRAARLWLAIDVRASRRALRDAHAADDARARAERCLARAAGGLGEDERRALLSHLLGMPDPWPGDLVPRRDDNEDEDWDMEIVSLLEINRRLVEQGDLASLLGEIVDAALKVTGAERGFLVLAENGELRFDTALDSRRGDIAQPDFEVSSSILHEALERMEPLRLSNAVDDPLLGHTPSVLSLELRSILCVPFGVDAKLTGAIYVDHRLRTGAFGEKAERLCALLADQAALAIRQIRRVEEIRGLNRRLQSKVESQREDLLAARRALGDAGILSADSGLVGGSAVMERVRTLIDRAAKSGMVVLVTGESGTGKEIAARALHQRSPRADGPFVSENCAALPPSLIESELFGYRRGAFTGAEEDREGLFERASGGTLFLDEIGEMPVELQAKLLRVLETGEVRRLGDGKERKVDFRLVVATNRDLAGEVREGRFREDLYYRLDGLRVEMPPLRARAEDVPELVAHFLRREETQGGAPRRASRDVLDRLSARAWPGNVRELRNEVARLCVLSEGDLIDASLVREPDPKMGASTALLGDGPPPSLAELEKRAILEALRHTDGDKRKAAEMLGISRAKIYQRLKDWEAEEGAG